MAYISAMLSDMASDDLPGEATPVPMRYLGDPISEAEALGVARRLARRTDRPVPDELPTDDAPSILGAYRLSPRVLAFTRARAEAEGVTVTDVVRAALAAYAVGRPGSVTSFQPG